MSQPLKLKYQRKIHFRLHQNVLRQKKPLIYIDAKKYNRLAISRYYLKTFAIFYTESIFRIPKSDERANHRRNSSYTLWSRLSFQFSDRPRRITNTKIFQGASTSSKGDACRKIKIYFFFSTHVTGSRLMPTYSSFVELP